MNLNGFFVFINKTKTKYVGTKLSLDFIPNDVILIRGITINAETKIYKNIHNIRNNWQVKDVLNPITSNLHPNKYRIRTNR